MIIFKLANIICAIVFGLFYKVDIRGIENVPRKGGAVICANHRGQLDMFFMGYKLKRMIHYMAKEELFRNPVLRFLLTRVGAFPVNRHTADLTSIRTALRLLSEGELVGVFPEGTRVKRGKIRNVKIKPGAVMLAVNAGVDIIPVSISGSYKPFSKVSVIFHKPVDPREYNQNVSENSKEFQSIAEHIMDLIYSHVQE